MDARILVVYGTTHGQAAKIAGTIAGTLRDAGATVVLANTATPWIDEPRDHDAVIVVASVHAGRLQRSVRQWVRAHRAALAHRPTALVMVCLAVLNRTPKVDHDLRAILAQFSSQTGWRPVETKVVAGALKYTKYGWFTRWMMKRIVAKAGGDVDTSRDYEYTDWDDLREFAQRFMRERLGAVTASPSRVTAEPART